MKRTVFAALLLLNVTGLSAQRIDFSVSNAQEAQTHEPDYTEWKIVKAPLSTLVLDNGMEFVISAAGKADMLRDQWNKNTCNAGRDGATGLRLLGDGVAAFIADGSETPQLTDTETSIEIKIKGFTAGTHTAMAYHVWKDAKTGDMPKIKVELKINEGQWVTKQDQVDFVNVKNPATDLKMADATYSYIDFEVEATDSVFIRYSTIVEAGKTYQTTNIMLNALLLDTSPFIAQDPTPNNLDYHVDGDDGTFQLQWTAGPTAVKHRLFIGTDKNSVAAVTTPDYEGDATTYNVSSLSSKHVYYWRVDEIDAEGIVHKGNLWSFRPRHLAFPEAEGYGRFAQGGRYGTVYHVTSLAGTKEPGTLLYGLCEMDEPRYIVFDVSGIIDLNFDAHFVKPYAYIAGQTAPGKGICIKGSNINIGSDVICRHIRFKRGLGVYGENTGNAMGMTGADHAIVDHCTAAWGTDETVSGRGALNISFQYSMIAEALGITGHKNYADGTNHGYAATIDGRNGSWHHNLLVNCEGRNWSMGGGMDANNIPIGGLDLFNNVCYNWHNRTTDGNCHAVNFVNNYYKMGPDTQRKTLFTQDFEDAINPLGIDQAFVSGNIRENKDHSQTTSGLNNATGNIPKNYDYLVSEPLFPSYAEIHAAKDAMKIVTSYAGATMPMRDNQHLRVVRETLQGTYTYVGSKSKIKGEIDSEADITEDAVRQGWEEYPEEKRDADWDTDQDGMPDWWEQTIGSDDSVANQNDDPDGDGYTLLEDYLEFMAHPFLILAPNTTGKIDVKHFFTGFYGQNGKEETPTFTIENQSTFFSATANGSIISAKANADAGVGILMVTVKDSEGSSFSQRLSVAVSGVSAGINDTSVNVQKTDGTLYSLSGQRVDSSYRGLVVKNGQKILQR